MRLFTVTTDTKAEKYISSHYKTVTLDTLRLPIFDCSGKLLVNREGENFVVAKPTENAVSLLYEKLNAEEFDSIAATLLQGNAGWVNVGEKFFPPCAGFVTLKKNIRYAANPTAVHLIGYTNYDGNGVSGIERSLNEMLKTDVTLSAGFLCDAVGDFVDGAEIQVESLYNNHRGGAYLTVDRFIQSVAEEELRVSSIKKGAAVVCDVETGEIKAMVSIPEYNPSKAGESLNDENLPLLNRALQAFPAGSVFKVVVAACALENGISENFSYTCCGKITVGGKEFCCSNAMQHGTVNMEKAVALSCNCYFINLADSLGGKALLETASLFGFGRPTEIAKDLASSEGVLPTADELKFSGALANFSFGQGRFTATPLQFINVFNAVAAGGKYVNPYCVKKVCDVSGEKIYEFKPKAPVYALSEATAEKILAMLTKAVDDGTARKAKTESFSSAGKTATAQTGIYKNGKEQLCTWFGGVFPAENPQYSVVILSEDGTAGGEDCAPVFRAIAQRIYERKVF